MVRRKKRSLATNKENHEQNKTTKQNLILDLLMVLDKTQTLRYYFFTYQR